MPEYEYTVFAQTMSYPQHPEQLSPDDLAQGFLAGSERAIGAINTAARGWEIFSHNLVIIGPHLLLTCFARREASTRK